MFHLANLYAKWDIKKLRRILQGRGKVASQDIMVILDSFTFTLFMTKWLYNRATIPGDRADQLPTKKYVSILDLTSVQSR